MIIGAIVAGYFLGTIPFAIIVSRVATRGRVDIRRTGSGNPGGFNTIREVGRLWGAVVILLDGGKALFAALLGWLIAGDAGVYAAATAAIAGHVWPVWTRFRGGRGVATAGGSFLSVFPPFFPIAAVFALVVTLIRKRPAFTIVLVCPLWVVAAGVWWAAGLSNWWGPQPAA